MAKSNELVQDNIKPMTKGVIMLAKFPHILNTPPATPKISFGEVSLKTHQPKLPKPLAKKAILIAATTITSELV